ncbi:hypothetical protein BJY00DRAFT_66505 [Aspergillus carlsbadensis]|nr:hypothetical protein BJY00DRAFT_66505 [Aspergillus carlsbadensis]
MAGLYYVLVIYRFRFETVSTPNTTLQFPMLHVEIMVVLQTITLFIMALNTNLAIAITDCSTSPNKLQPIHSWPNSQQAHVDISRGGKTA